MTTTEGVGVSMDSYFVDIRVELNAKHEQEAAEQASRLVDALDAIYRVIGETCGRGVTVERVS